MNSEALPPNRLLPELPALDRLLLKSLAVQTPSGCTLEALEAVADNYRCQDLSAPTLLLIPGLGLDGSAFVRQLPLGALAHLRLFHTPDEPVLGKQGLEHYVHYIEQFVAAQRLDERPGGLVLGGNSMGGAISLLVAASGKVKLRGLVLIGTYGSCQHLPRWQRWLSPLAWVIPFGMIRRGLWRSARWFGASSTDESKWMMNCRRRSLGYFGRSISALTRLDCLSQARQISVPTLILHGSNDRVLPFAAAIQLQQHIAGAELVKIEEAGHSLFFTHAQPVNAAIAEWLGRLPKDGGA